MEGHRIGPSPSLGRLDQLVRARVNLQAVRQHDRGLRAYTASFAAELDFLEHAGLTYNTLVLAMYLSGMDKELAQLTYTELSVGATDALAQFRTKDLAKALQQVADVAANHEDVRQRYGGGSATASGRAANTAWKARRRRLPSLNTLAWRP